MKPVIHELFVKPGLRNHPGRDMQAIDYITIHTTGNHNSGATAEAHARFQYTGGGGRQASWHYTVDANEIWQSFRDQQMCWHTGTTRGNERSIGIEICVNSRDGFGFAVHKSAFLTAFLLKEHNLGVDKVVQHQSWSGKNCPAELRSKSWGISWDDFLVLVRRHLQGEVAFLDEDLASQVIGSLRDARINFDEQHWQGVLRGTITPNRDWTTVLAGRIIENRWSKFTPQVIGSAIMALLGQRNL